MKRISTLVLACAAWSYSANAQITIYPYVQDFESEATCGTGAGTPCPLSTSGFFNQTVGDDIDWTVDINGTGSANTGPTANGGADHNPGVAGGKYLYLESSATAGNPNSVGWLESPVFDFTALAVPTLSYWSHLYGTSQGTLQIDVSTDLGATWVNVEAPYTDNLDMWQEHVVDLTAYAGMGSVMIRWHGITGTSFGSDMAIDDVSVYEPDPFDLEYVQGPSPVSLCASAGVSGDALINHLGATPILTGDSIHITWDDGTNIFTETIILAADLNPGGSLLHVFTTPLDFSVAGTYNATSYINYAGDASNINDTIAYVITAAPTVNVFPYLETFAAGNGGWVADNAANGNWELGMPAQGIINTAYSDTMSWMTGLTANYSSNSNSWVDGPCFDFTNSAGDEWVSMAIFRETEDSWDGSNLFYSIDGGTTWNIVGAFGDPDWYTDNSINGAPGGAQDGWEGTGAGWEFTKHELDASVHGQSDVKFRVYFGSDGSVTQQGIAFDNFAISSPFTVDILPDTVNVCDTLLAVDAGTGWQRVEWSTGTVGQMDTLSGSGQYIVTVWNDYGLCAKDTFEVNFSDFVPANLAEWDFVCKGDTLWLDAGADTLNMYTYDWSTTETTQMIGVTVGGIYTVLKTDSAGVCSELDSIDVILPPVANLGNGTTEVCTGVMATLDAGVAGQMYNWNTGETTQTIMAGPGSYAVTMIDTFGCLSTSATSVVDGTPTVILGNDLIHCLDDMITLDAGNPGLTYSWSTGGTAQMETITAATLGVGTHTITVDVTSAGGCVGTDMIDIVVNPCTFVEEALGGVSVELYPNPTSGQISIAIEDMKQAEMTISVLNLQGQVIESRVINNNATNYIVDFDLTDLAAGVYMVKFENENGAAMQRIVKD